MSSWDYTGYLSSYTETANSVLSVGAIIGIVIGCLAGLALLIVIIVIIIIIVKKKPKRTVIVEPQQQQQQQQISPINPYGYAYPQGPNYMPYPEVPPSSTK